MFSPGVLHQLLLFALLLLLIAVAVIDLRRGVIPNWCNAAILALGLAGAAAGRGPSLGEAIFTLLLAGSAMLALRQAFFLWRGRAGLGMGDVKFLAAAGTFTGLEGLLTLILIASLSGLLYLAAKLMVGSEVKSDTRLPFGPHLAVSLAGVSLFGAPQ